LVLIFWGKKTIISEVPFGPFLVTGTLIALFRGEAIMEWYLQLAAV
jgi:prepilin signal peptidase PulO-like enzyme (type II secretory pathway)